MQDILRHLDAYQEKIGNSAAISPAGFARLNDMANKLRAATVTELTGCVQRIDPGMDERARQARLQGHPGDLMGRRHD